MARPAAVVNYQLCDPERCPDGRCAARMTCQVNVIWQEAPWEQPMIRSSACLGCGTCRDHCPQEAINFLK